MTITSTNRLVTFPGQGSVGPYAYPFFIFQNADLAVSTTDAAGGIAVLRLGVDYTMTGAANSAGGTVTLTVALAIGLTLTLQRTVLVEQQTDLRNQGEFFPAVYEDALDYGIMVAQQLTDSIALLVQDFATVGSLQAQVTTNTTNITALTITVTNHSSSISTINTEIVSIDTEITNLTALVEQGVPYRGTVRVPYIFKIAGSFSHTVTAGVTNVEIEAWGAGGGNNSTGSQAAFVGGGGGGAYVWARKVVAGGDVLAIVVGAGGTPQVAGGDSTINSTVVVAGGGEGSVDSPPSGQALGGTATSTLANAILLAGQDGSLSYCDNATAPQIVSNGGASPRGGLGARASAWGSGYGGFPGFTIQDECPAMAPGGGGASTALTVSFNGADGMVIIWEYT